MINSLINTKPGQTLLLFILSLLWAGVFLFVKIADQSMQPLTLMAGRAVFGTLFIFCILLLQGKWHLIKAQLNPRSQRILLFNGICIAFMWFTIAKSEQVITVAMASFLLTSLAVFSWIIATFFTRERSFYLLNLFGIIVSVFAFIIMLGFKEIFHGNKSVWYALLYAIGILVFVIGSATMKHSKINVKPIVGTLYSLFYAMIFLLLFAFIFEHPIHEHYNASALISVLGLGILSTGIGYMIFFSLVTYAGQIFASLNGYLVPVLGFIIGILFMKEPYAIHQILALLVILIGMFATNYSKSIK
ncbi:MAG: DMT family transporter [Pseudomonadota bacterium]